MTAIVCVIFNPIFTFRVSHRRRETYCGHAHLWVCVCLSAAACLHYCTDPDVTWGSDRGCPPGCALLGGFAIGARVALLWNSRNAWQSPAVIRQAHRTHYACRRILPSPAIKSTHLQRGRSISSILRGCCNANAKC